MADQVPPTRDFSALDRLDLDSLVGLTVVQAWKLVKNSGGYLRRLDDQPVTLGWDRSRNRVTVIVRDRRVVQVVGRG